MSQEMAAGATEAGLTFAYRLGRLFEASRRRNESPQTNSQVAEAVSAILGRPVAAQTIAALLHGKLDSPGDDVLSALVRHFKVDEDYLFGTPEQQLLCDRNLDLYILLRDEDMPLLALRTRSEGLSSATVEGLCDLIRDVRARYASPRSPLS